MLSDDAHGSKAFPLNQLDTDALAHPPTDAVQAAWVGHACVLVQMEGVTFITDPVLSERCSPVQFLGPRRVVAAPYAPESDRMPKLDFVLISHNHYDHLDTTSVKRIHRQEWRLCSCSKIILHLCLLETVFDIAAQLCLASMQFNVQSA